MKYIRTEKGHIYEYVEQRIHPSQYLKFGQYRHNLNSEYEQIIAQADTIEELCDKYVGISNNKPMIIIYEFDEYYDEYNDTYTKEELIEVYDVIYGAIWIDKGLIYVAKMNENGVLELI